MWLSSTKFLNLSCLQVALLQIPKVCTIKTGLCTATNVGAIWSINKVLCATFVPRFVPNIVKL